MKKIIFFLFFLLFFSHFIELKAKSSYPLGESSVKQCIDAYLNGGKDPDLKKMGTINNPIDSKRYLMCQGKTSQIVLYQAVLDVLFSEIDKKVESYLKTLEGAKDYTKGLFDARIKLGVSGEFGSFAGLYGEVCNSGIMEYSSSFLEKNKLSSLNTDSFTQEMVKDFNGVTICEGIYRTKLNAYYTAAEIIIEKAVVTNYVKDKKTFTTKLKKQYEDFLFKLTIYIGQLGVIKSKWNTSSKDCRQ